MPGAQAIARWEDSLMSKALRSDLGTLWCSLMHDSPMWPVHGEYQCRMCGRRYPAFAEAPAAGWTKTGGLRAAASLFVAFTIVGAATPARAADAVKERGKVEAEAALERYARGGTPSWTVEAIEIHASLPRLAKTGHLEAIRGTVGPDGAGYQIIRLTGDGAVKDQVIARYLNAQQRASQMAPSSVAVTPANYRFAYKGIVDDGEWLAYVFRMTPRKRRDGLIKGELWLDIGTGLPIRRSGYFVKNPSLWIRRIAVTQEDSLRDGRVESRLTHVSVDTRLVGRAELVVAERPLRPEEGRPVAVSSADGGQQ
jgi:hypothetical protein